MIILIHKISLAMEISESPIFATNNQLFPFNLHANQFPIEYFHDGTEFYIYNRLLYNTVEFLAIYRCHELFSTVSAFKFKG